MKLVIDIPDEMYYIATKGLLIGDDLPLLNEVIANGKPLANITDEQISDAFQIAIANYWDEKSKHLTPPPTPCNCPNKKGEVTYDDRR